MKFLFGFVVCILSFLMISQNVASEKSKATILYTPSSRDFVNWYPVPDTGIFKFQVRARVFTIILASYPVYHNPKIEIGMLLPEHFTLGEIWRDSNSVSIAHIDTKYYVSEEKFTGYWVTWFNNNIEIGIEGETNAFVAYNDPNPFPINYIGVNTLESDKPGIWIIENN